MRRAILTASFCLSWALSSEAAETMATNLQTSPFVVRTWQVEDGLPHNSVNDILQTRDGYLWLATGDGLARFDGVHFTVFGLAEGLPSLQVLKLLEDQAGALWIGTSLGLSRLRDGRLETWKTKDGLAGNEVTALAQDRDGAIWVGTPTGLNRWQNGRLQTLGKAEGLNDKRVRALAAYNQGGICVSMFFEGLLRWDGNKFVQMGRQQGAPEAPPIVSLLQDRGGRLWAGTTRGIVLCLEEGHWRLYGPEHGLPTNSIVRLAEGTDGTIWAALSSGGLYSLARDNSSTSMWQKADFPNWAVSLLEDREQNLWVGARAQGLSRLRRKRVSVISIESGKTEALPGALAETADGVLWVGTGSRGVFRIQHGQADLFMRDTIVRGYYTVLAPRDGSLWCAAGPALWQWKDGKLLSAYKNEYRTWLREDRIRVLCENRQEGLWVGTQNGQLRLLRGGQFLALTNWHMAQPITALVEQSDGTLLVGTYGSGLFRVHNGQYSALTPQRGAVSPFIRTLYQDTNQVLWIGTEGAGLSWLEEGRLTTLTTRNGLLNDTIVQILEDDTGHLWLGSYRGILRLSKHELKAFAEGKTTFVHPLILDRSDGLPSEQCMPGSNSRLKTRDGLLHFSTGRGIVIVNPAQQRTNAPPPTVWLERMLVDADVYYSSIQSSLASAASGAQTAVSREKPPLKIPPGKRRLEFRYTGLGLRAPEHVHFRYQLEGLDDHWMEAGQERMVFYSLLPAGHYRFRVTACGDSGNWNKQEATLSFEVEPFFWQTWWFRLSLLGGAMAGVVGLVRYVSLRRLRRRLRRLEQEAAVQKERARIAKDLHDDLGGHLSQIAILSELAQSDIEKPAQAREHIDLIFRTARSVTRSLDEIVWAVNPRSDSLEQFAAQMSTFAPEFLRAPGITCRLDVPVDLPAITLPANVRHHLYLAFKEVLHNVVKHADATEVWLRLKISPRELTLAIEDNGRGFRPSMEGRAGEDGLVNLRQRMAEAGGRLEQESEPARGTCTTLIVPIEQAL